MKCRLGLVISLCVALAGASALLFGMSTVSAQINEPRSIETTIVVNTLEDELNEDGDCSLREAIQAANTDMAVDSCQAGNGYDNVILPAGVYILSIPGRLEDNNATGDLDIRSSLSIKGENAKDTIIDGNQLDRVFDVFGASDIQDVTIQNGYAPSGDPAWYYGGGGGIKQNASQLTVSKSIIRNNTTETDGGGIYTRSGTLLVEDSQIIGNKSGDLFSGGGVSSYYEIHSNIQIRNSIISENTAGRRGGGLAAWGGEVILSGNTINSNTASRGGGLYISGWDDYEPGNATIENNLIISNTGYGGGVYAYVMYGTISNNLIFNNSDGLIIDSGPPVIRENIISSNTNAGIGLYDTGAILLNNIISDNRGVGIEINGIAGSLFYNTLARNKFAGLLVTEPIARFLHLKNTIIVSNTYGILTDDCSGNPTTIELEATLWGEGAWANEQDWSGGCNINTGTINIWGDPNFLAPDSGDYHIGLNSDAINAGIDVRVYSDIDGDIRPFGAGYDIGADEFISGILISPTFQEGSEAPGTAISYPIVLSNLSNITDTYYLAVGQHRWETDLSTTQIGPLPINASQQFTVTVIIPQEASWYDSDSIVITATSITSPTVCPAIARVRTQAYASPQIVISPSFLSTTQYIDQIVTLPMTISNGFGVTLTFSINTSKIVLWLNIDPASGVLFTNSSVQALASLDATDLSPDIYTATLGVESNDPAAPSVNVPVTMTVLEPVAPLSVTIDGITEGLVGYSYPLTITVSPISTTLPINYMWQASGQASVTHTGGLTDSIAYTWELPGIKVITATASNIAGNIEESKVINVVAPEMRVYLPLLSTAGYLDKSAERAALVALYNSTNGDGWRTDTGWGTDASYCDWYGVTCDQNGHVTVLDLYQTWMIGALPPEIGNLASLQWLVLGSNTLVFLPPEIGNLASLQELYLGWNRLSSFPPEIGNLVSLGVLLLYSNSLSGSIPAFLSNLNNLVRLELSSQSR